MMRQKKTTTTTNFFEAVVIVVVVNVIAILKHVGVVMVCCLPILADSTIIFSRLLFKQP